MRAITVHQPWATLIATGHKQVENRSWAPPAALVGQRIAIHAGQKFLDNEDLWTALLQVMGEKAYREVHDSQHDLGAIVCVATLARVLEPGTRLDDGHPMAPWYGGKYGFVLTDVKRLAESVEVSGQQRFWVVPADVERKVLAQLP